MTTAPTSDFLTRIRIGGDPVADPASVVTVGGARFTVLTTRLLRLEWSAVGVWEDRATFAFPHRKASVPSFQTRTEDGVFVLETGALVLRYEPSDGPFSAANLRISFTLDDNERTWVPGLSNPTNLRGTRRTLDGTRSPEALEEGIVSRAGWAVFDDSASTVLNSSDGWVEARSSAGGLDWYFFGYGHEYAAALGDYTHFGGRVPLIPRFVLGAWWSRYWAYSDQDLKNLVDDFARHDLPLDVLVLDMDWHTTDSWTGYSWNSELFPDPVGFLRWAHERGLRTTLNLHPAEGVQAFEKVYPTFAKLMGLDPASKAAVPFQITERTFARHYFELLHHPLEEQGVDFWWMDWQQGKTCELPGLDPLIWINHLHFHDSARRGTRPLLYSRWGGLGNHRYPIGFSGDTLAAWSALAFLPYFTATAANVAFGWWSHDIGGHFGATDPELFVRWVQYGALSPCLRLHASKDPLAERRPWTFPTPVLDASRAAFHLRYALVPYLYTMARRNTDSGITLCRPMYYAYPKHEAAYVARGQYFLGDDLIAAPIVSPADPATGLASIDVWIPPGTWIDYTTHETFRGPHWVRLVGGLDRIPLLVRAGVVVPLAPVASTTDAQPKDHVIVAVFLDPQGSATSTTRLYDDDGTSLGYLTGAHEWTSFTLRSLDAQTSQLEIAGVEGSCPALPSERRYTIQLIGSQPPAEILLNDHLHADWYYETSGLTTVINVPAHTKQAPLTITVRAGAAITELGTAHNAACRTADIARLVPELANSTDSVDALLVVQTPAAITALARSGGPGFHILDYVAPEDAAQQLGTVIVSAPAVSDQAEPYSLTLTWRLADSSGTTTETMTYEHLTTDLIAHNPFALGDRIRTMQWSVEGYLAWRGATLPLKYRSQPLFPAIAAWQVVIFNAVDAPITADQLFDAHGALNPALAWRTYAQQLADVRNTIDPYAVLLFEDNPDRLKRSEALGAYAVTQIISPDAREVVIDWASVCALEFTLNGVAVPNLAPPNEPQLRTRFPAYLRPRKTEVTRLQPGRNTLIVHIVASPADPYWTFGFGVALERPSGELITDLSYEGLRTED